MKKVTIQIELPELGESPSVWSKQKNLVCTVLDDVKEQIQDMIDTEADMIHGSDTSFRIKGHRNAFVRIGSKQKAA
jgi:hypothetical protein